MKQSTEDKTKGTFHEVKGEVKEKVGQVTNMPDLADEGKAEKIDGKIDGNEHGNQTFHQA